ncbi:MAG: hypothetical protein JWM59_3284 [Verrucomicrobiales bacterium]|nr:hypothetical protein [Verrucomicrobiales bacterium]
MNAFTETTVESEFLRIPAAIKFSGLGRTTIYQAIAEGRLQSKCIRRRGALRGIRLISKDALRAFIENAD